ncbi:sigma-70 family RNA polymerase sigma factor [Demequina litorisediminis]|uniref:RNA polymerase subunit sigma-24 n=1 Tax=Demequina litorisediminis TaxID=1849022 RepID=A0ABQ6IE28_9MICO|nr:sigma-70 family RNA polymerase sigma factor [Demequina litorisediminis]GMA35242.1 RNA polymerase subunit sigma-24 [Demequina litorisediminis]
MSADDDLMRELLARAGGRLAAYGYLLTGTQHAGEDLVQDAIVKVFVRRRRLANAAAAEGYVRAAMRTLHLDRMRRESRWRRVAPGLVERTELPDHADAVAVADAVARGLDALSPRQRTAVVLRYFDDLPVVEVAHEMRLATGTVKRYLSEALERMGGVLGADPERTEVVSTTTQDKEARR